MIDKNILEGMTCIIDTQQISFNKDNIEDINIEDHNCINNKKRKDDFINNSITLVVNLHKRYGAYNMIDEFQEYKREFVRVMKEIGIISLNDINFDRVDIAIDSNIDFKKDFKLLLFIFELITCKSRKGSRWFTTSLDTLCNNTIKKTSKFLDISFYDKEYESNGSHKFKTRMEFRFKNHGTNNINGYIDKLLSRLNLVKNIDKVEGYMITRLIELWESEKNTKVKNLSEFVRKYDNYIYTKNILEGVYQHVSMNGNFNNWLREHRRNSNIKFYSKSNIQKVEKQIIKSIKIYNKT